MQSNYNTLIKLVFIVLLAPVTAAIAGPEVPFLINAEQLKHEKNNQELIIVDVRPAALYKQGHLEKAISIPADDTFGLGPNNDRVAPPMQIQTLLSRNGIRNDHHLVIYDDGNLKDAARFFWVMEIYGHVKLSVLNGGLSAARHAGFNITQTPYTLATRSNYVPMIQHRFLSTKFMLRLSMNNPHYIIVDSRSAAEFSGHQPKSPRVGHIPTAVNIPWENNLEPQNDTRQLRPIAQLRQMYNALDPQRKIIAYCHRGKESAVTYFVLRVLGYDISIYDGAWIEWSNDPTLPITVKH